MGWFATPLFYAIFTALIYPILSQEQLRLHTITSFRAIINSIFQMLRKQSEKLFWRPILIAFFVVLALWAVLLDFLFESPEWIIYNCLVGRFLAFVLISVGPELAGIAIGFTTVDYLNEKRQEQQYKKQLILQLGSENRDVADTALLILKSLGWGFGEDKTLEQAYLWGANLRGANLESINLKGAELIVANLEAVYFKGANLERVDFEGAKLNRASFGDANLEMATFWTADLEGASFAGGNMKGVGFPEANLKEAHFGYVDLSGVYFGDANLEGAVFWSVNLRGVRELSPQQLKWA